MQLQSTLDPAVIYDKTAWRTHSIIAASIENTPAFDKHEQLLTIPPGSRHTIMVYLVRVWISYYH